MIGYCGLFLILLLVNSILLDDIKDLSINELLKLAEDISQVKIGDVKNNDITFYLSTRSEEEPTIINNETKNTIDLTKPTKFIIHGWIANSKRSWYGSITEEFLKNGDCNVIQVDWERPARTAYVSSAINSKLIGRRIAQFIEDVKILPKNIHFIGHSLGAHIAGFAAKIIMQRNGERISRISGLDPAGPYFREYMLFKGERLDKDDANVVDAIHTDAGYIVDVDNEELNRGMYGVDFPIGTLDIYVNGGRGPQPGCLYNFNVTSIGDFIERTYCNHARSTIYFSEWINNGKFHCKLCQPWDGLLTNRCGARTVRFGEEDVNENLTGICIARTRRHQPFLYD